MILDGQSDLLNELASWIVGQAPAGYQQVAAIEQWLLLMVLSKPLGAIALLLVMGATQRMSR
jgi:hypothetical protein